MLWHNKNIVYKAETMGPLGRTGPGALALPAPPLGGPADYKCVYTFATWTPTGKCDTFLRPAQSARDCFRYRGINPYPVRFESENI
jgi:hypothetical protein